MAYLLDSLHRERVGGVSDEEECAAITIRSILAGAAFLVVFLSFSPGTLPQHVRGLFSAYLLLAHLLLGSVLIESVTLSPKKLLQSGIAASVALALVYTAIAIAMIKRGAPGDAFSFELFTSVHVAELLKTQGRIGLIFLFFASLGLIPDKNRQLQEGWGIPSQLQRLALCAVIVRIFSVSSLGSFWEIHTHGVLVADFYFFWGQVFILRMLVAAYARVLAKLFQKDDGFLFNIVILLVGVLFLASELSYKL